MKVKTIPSIDTQQKQNQLVLIARTNLDAFKAFDFEDDLEFCPVAFDESADPVSSRSSTPTSVSSSFSTTPERSEIFNRASLSPDSYFSPNVRYSKLNVSTPVRDSRAINLNNQYSPQKFYSVPVNPYGNANISASANVHAADHYATTATNYQLHNQISLQQQQQQQQQLNQFQASRNVAQYAAAAAATTTGAANNNNNNNNNNNILLAQTYNNQLTHGYNNNISRKRFDFSATQATRSINHANHYRGRVY